MQNFRDLEVWQNAHQLTLSIYELTEQFPQTEKYGLRSQMRRSSSSIPMNIAEGCGQGGDPQFGRYLNMAIGSANELDYQLELAKDLEYITESVFEEIYHQLTIVKKMLVSLRSELNNE
ncbi:MAG: four helix bundle protein [bacterium]